MMTSYPSAIKKVQVLLLERLAGIAPKMAPDTTSTADALATLAVSTPDMKEDVKPLFTPTRLGDYTLENRMAMAPLTRCRGLNMVPSKAAITYYTQRAYPGSLLISEGTPISQAGQGYPHVPGVYTDEQIEAWKPIVRAVKEKGTIFFMQIWHCGRVSHSDYQPDGGAPLAPSALRITKGDVYTPKGGPYPFPEPREMTKADIAEVIEQFAQGAENAVKKAGFDGVEIHGANTYLLDEFLKDETNHRTDEYGGPIENRCRFVLELVKAVVDRVGAGKTGIRFSPFTTYYDCSDSHPYGLFCYLLEELNKLNLAYVHFVEPRIQGISEAKTADSLAPFRAVWKGTFLAAGGFDREKAIKAIETEHADVIVFGRHWLANPDLPRRFQLDAPLNKYDRDTFYTHDPVKGYTDYPFLEDVEKSESTKAQD
ncbi:12-oxophytodienoic acid reductase 3 [Klebsormidium nitens]|uniref:12-oxophytodienoic acid reductase 3 n=1 Tax=Klebsormidium nitens TaxID=105231 RepID=A0A1Y1IIG2_KLENI|nr:12-oxophytodienoic acid reductase 3 [Klebsormidium nitens]|eukprot:GAQ90493.1 12-oxophytodienoic acid reductase 3 [Klebsormidium nitens]